MKQLLKKILNILHITITRNQRYDAYTLKILRKVLKPGSNAVDIGCHLGEILDEMIRFSPQGKKFGFEPIPEFFSHLEKKYSAEPLVSVFPLALFDKAGTTTFQHVINKPAYSGIKKRRYDGKQVEIRQINVATELLDHIIPEETPVDLIKIDVEGAELAVMRGGVKTIRRCRPVIIFECGIGASDFYGTKPEEVYGLLNSECNLHISTLQGFLDGGPLLTGAEFSELYYSEKEFYFVAHP
jgi:FkbM family methyltransferase